MNKHEELTQQYSTWGDKLLQHADVLHSIQSANTFKPITVQLAPCEVCDSKCPFCSVGERPLSSFMPWETIENVLREFRALGAKCVEITGGGNPLLYRDKEADRDINSIISCAHALGMKVGIITNSHDLKAIEPRVYKSISWIRISLIKLDEGKEPEDYHFRGFPEDRMGFSYIIYDGTTDESFIKMFQLSRTHPEVKFVRLAGDCLIKGNNVTVSEEWQELVDITDEDGKFFFKDIGDDDGPYNDGCYVGMIRPYVAPDPHGGTYRVYACTSHVLNTRTYDPAYALCGTSPGDIALAWQRMNENYAAHGYPYEVKDNRGKAWCDTCKFCYYQFNNKLLHTVAQKMPDGEFA